nr:ATP-binding protein [uncultured Blautia sp.]
MSHDIRTPINGIMGMLNIGDHFPEDMEKQAECREKIRGASSFLFELVNDVLDMSKMESGKIELEEVPFDLLDLLDEVVSMIEVQAMGHGLDFIYERHEKIHRQVIGSPVHLRQILMNIAGNAVKYNRENGSIRLAYQETAFDGANATFEFVCADTGKGMSKEFQEHMFEPFSQEENGARTTFGGSGLGLSIVQKLVEKMNGQISVVSEEGKGSTFTITLTLRVDPLTESDSREPELKTQRKSIKGIRILLAEDNALNMEIAEFILESEGAVITKAWNGQEAVDIFQNSDEGTFDIILMDVMMPVMDGLSATRTIREMDRKDAREIPIIAMTANAFDEDRKRSREAGMDRHLAKPLDPREIVKTISECISHKK